MKAIFKITAFVLLLIATACVEPYALQTKNFDDALVIEATITNEMKHQEIRITHTFRFEDDGPATENGANVFVEDDQGNSFDFEFADSTYISTTPFQAQPGRSYRLTIETTSGKTYTSTSEALPTVNPIGDVTTKVTELEGVPGVQIVVSSFDPTGSSRYYRYEYSETYKIVVPTPAIEQAVFVNGNTSDDYTWNVTPIDYEVRTCFKTLKNPSITLTTTAGFGEDRVSEFPVRFIPDVDPMLRERYSINVRQYVQNLAAYSFYKTMKELSGNGSLLSQNQPGFFYGNISNLDNSSEKVLGFFDVSSVSEQRIFINFTDIFPGRPLPAYPYDCYVTDPYLAYQFCIGDPPCDGWTVLNGYQAGNWILLEQETFGMPQSPFLEEDFTWVLAPPQCANCTTFSSNIRPSFWVD